MSETTQYKKLQINNIPDTKKIASLANRPNRQGPNGTGYTAEELKAYFDLASGFLQDYINTALLSNGDFIKISDSYTDENGNTVNNPASLKQLVKAITDGGLSVHLYVGEDDICLKDSYIGLKDRDISAISAEKYKNAGGDTEEGIKITLSRVNPKRTNPEETDFSNVIALEDISVDIPFSDFKSYIEEKAREDFEDNARLECAYDNGEGTLTVSLKHGEEIVNSSVVYLPLESVITDIDDYTENGKHYLKLIIQNKRDPIIVELDEIFTGYAREDNVYDKKTANNNFISNIEVVENCGIVVNEKQDNPGDPRKITLGLSTPLGQLLDRISNVENETADASALLHMINEGGIL